MQVNHNSGDQSMFSSFVEGSTKTSGELLGRLYKKLASIPLQSLKRLMIGNQGKNLWAFHKFKKDATREFTTH